MSFILDALKKSENERARQNGPALLQTRIVPRRPGVPAWAVAIGVVLLANLAVIGYVLLRPAPSAPSAPPRANEPAPPAPVTPTAATSAAAVAPPAPAPALAPLPETRLPPPTPSAEPASPSADVVNPADFQPARPPGTVSRTAPEPADQGGIDPALPTAAELASSGLPEMRLALHSFDENPANRYVLLNSQRLREGETMQDGVRVERITADGVILSWRGQRFRLQPGE